MSDESPPVGEFHQPGQSAVSAIGPSPWTHNAETPSDDVPVIDLSQCIAWVSSGDRTHELQGMLILSKLETRADVVPPSSSVVAHLSAFLRRDDDPVFLLEALRCLANLLMLHDASLAQHVVNAGSVGDCTRLLASPSGAIQEQAALTLGSVARKSVALRALVLTQGAMEPLTRCITCSEQLPVLRAAVSAVSALCRGKPSPDLSAVAVAIPILVQLLGHQDAEVVGGACWSLAYISDGQDGCIERVMDTGALPQIVRLLGSTESVSVMPALRTIGTIVTRGSTDQLKDVVAAGALPLFRELLVHKDGAIRKEACFTLSNVLSEGPELIQAVLDAGLFPSILDNVRPRGEPARSGPPLLFLRRQCPDGPPQPRDDVSRFGARLGMALPRSGVPQPAVDQGADAHARGKLRVAGSYEANVKAEALCCVNAVVTYSTPGQLRSLMDQPFAKSLIGTLLSVLEVQDTQDSKTLHATLDALQGILESGDQQKDDGEAHGPNPYVQMILDNGGLATIKAVADNLNIGVSDKAEALVLFFHAEDSEE